MQSAYPWNSFKCDLLATCPSKSKSRKLIGCLLLLCVIQFSQYPNVKASLKSRKKQLILLTAYPTGPHITISLVGKLSQPHSRYHKHNLDTQTTPILDFHHRGVGILSLWLFTLIIQYYRCSVSCQWYNITVK